MYRKTGRRSGTAVLLLLLLLLCSGCAVSKLPEEPYLLGNDDAFSSLVLEQIPGLGRAPVSHTSMPNPFYAVSRGNLAAVFDIQAVPAVRCGVGGFFRPQILTTVVFAVDRDQTDFRPRTWRQLLQTPVTVGLSEEAQLQRMVLSSAAYALGAGSYDMDAALELFSQLRDRAHFKVTPGAAPITLCLDSQAASRLRSGENIDIVVPRDGTLSFSLGLLSRAPLAGVSDAALLNAGFRLPDGRCTAPEYPEPAAYRAAAAVSDFEAYEMLTHNAVRDLYRTVLHGWLYSIGWHRTLQLMLCVVLIVFWFAAALYRTARRDVRRWLGLVSLLCIGWLMLTVIKYQLPPLSPVNRMCWYAFYIFLMGLPLALLSIAAVIDRPTGGRHPNWFYPIAAIYPLLVLMVFTNDFHRFVFQFDLNGNWSEFYTYGPGYYLIFLYCALVFLGAIALLTVRSWSSPKRYTVLAPIGIALLLLGYNAAYALGIPLARQSILPLVFCILVALFAEAVLNSGLIPINTHYKTLFARSGLNMLLLDHQGKTALLSAGARPLNREQTLQVLLDPGKVLTLDENTLLHSQQIRGGYVVWQEDITLLRQLSAQIAQSVAQIESANALLRRQSDVSRQAFTAQAKSRLFDMLEQDIADKSLLLSQAVRRLPDCADRDKQLSYITLLLCHIKRRCNLFFLAQQGTLLDSSELAVYLDELSEFAGFSGIHALVRSNISGALSISAATLFYDFFFSVLSWAVLTSGATLLGQLEEKEGRLCFSILSSEPTASLSFTDQFRQSALELGAEVQLHSQDDTHSIVLLLPPKSEGRHD